METAVFYCLLIFCTTLYVEKKQAVFFQLASCHLPHRRHPAAAALPAARASAVRTGDRSR
eukprot:366621-Prymnesium_polylepis.2